MYCAAHDRSLSHSPAALLDWGVIVLFGEGARYQTKAEPARAVQS